ncbi:uncharacterized protein EI97DRAFT_475122 [Westerdykella ornata]|uniref:Deoxyribonuclease NucA/NucB domain-containing protein n=1 Tax=Westerdykella ornata TaxID=318751 RepID=A0A6A6JHS1_WESOR|nr:uncharacterized protein EI97DRAFT_475122 [Westerdykella ornata]KAF2275744.1 hypothetical protein EI97DRAFT_475122 [Westerdykella ornata]
MIDITGWEDSAEFNCWAMLCHFGGERTWQRRLTESEGRSHYRESGAYFHPFRANELGRRGTAQITPQTDSAEEFPWESMHRGGQEALLFPTTQDEQNAQGGHLQALSAVGDGRWFHITFFPSRLFKRYCGALMVEPPQRPDFSVCREDNKQKLFGKWIELASYVYKRRQNRQGNQAVKFDRISGSTKRSLKANAPEDSEKREATE